MQSDRFTTMGRDAVAAAMRIASQRRNTEAAPAHLLLAILQQDDGFAPPIPVSYTHLTLPTIYSV